MAGISSNALRGTNYPENRMKSNGKELQRNEFADGSGLQWYDYGARMQDPQIERWHALDSLAAKYYGFSPYNYVLNNPISMLDPNGMEVMSSGAGTYYTGSDATEVFAQFQGFANSMQSKWDKNKEDDKDKNKNKGNAKKAYGPALLPFAEGAFVVGTAILTGNYHIPTSDDWAAAWNALNATFEYIPNGGRAGELIDWLRGRPQYTPTVHVDPAIAKKLYDELTEIYKKTLSIPGAVYALKATVDGDYNVYTSGFKLPTTTVPLKRGDIWKYGETTNLKDRYDLEYLKQEKVSIYPLGSGTQLQIKVMEKLLIYGYFFENGKLPPGNKIFR